MLSDQLLRQMVDALPTPVFVTDENQAYVYANRAFETLFQVRMSGLEGRSAAEIAPSLPNRLTESTTFATSDGGQFTMTMIHTASVTAAQNDELDAARAELRSLRSELARMRETDPVTQALSRRALRAHTDDAFGSDPAGVVRISVDDYETVRREFGLDTADELLSRFSDIVRSNTRPGDVFARIGESEFTLVLRNADREQTGVIARRIAAAVTDARTADGKAQLALSVTVGAAYSDATELELSGLIEQAERAMNSATRCRNEAIVA